MRAPRFLTAILGAMIQMGPANAQVEVQSLYPQASVVSPVGYSSAVNTPTSKVLDRGTLSMSLSNNNPEIAQRIRGVGGFGSLNFGVG